MTAETIAAAKRLAEELMGLDEKATPGPWSANPKRLMVGEAEGPIMSYLAGGKATPPGMTVSLASERIADHNLVAFLRNNVAALLALAEDAALVRDCVYIGPHGEFIVILGDPHDNDAVKSKWDESLLAARKQDGGKDG